MVVFGGCEIDMGLVVAKSVDRCWVLVMGMGGVGFENIDSKQY